MLKQNNTYKITMLSNACPRTFYEYNYQKYFVDNNCEISFSLSDLKYSDSIIFLSCAINNIQIQRSQDIIKFLVNKFPQKNKIVIGCLPKFFPEDKLFRGENLIYINSPDNIAKLWDFSCNIKNYFGGYGCISNDNDMERMKYYKAYPLKIYHDLTLPLSFYNKLYLKGKMFYELPWYRREYYHILVSTGCNNNCVYCPIKVIRPRSENVSSSNILSGFKKGLENGFRKFFLHSDDLGYYKDSNLADIWELLNILHSFDGEYTFKLWSISPPHILNNIEKLEKLLKKKRIKVIVMPIQSASNRVLLNMNRNYNIKDVQRAIIYLKTKFSFLQIVTQAIVGFPGEGFKDFLQTVEFFKNMPLSYVFPSDVAVFYEHICRPYVGKESKIQDEEKKKREQIMKKIIRYKRRKEFLTRFMRRYF